jgi:hypothetical protein
VDHSSANCWRYAAARRGIAPSEWLTRYVQVARLGNSRRQAMRGSDIFFCPSTSTPELTLGPHLGTGDYMFKSTHTLLTCV